MTGTREQLIIAAKALLLSDGLSGLSMRKVGASCGITAAAIYRHFPDKDALLASLVGEAFGTFMGYLGAALTEPTAGTRFRRVALQYLEFADQQPAYYRLIFMTDCEELGFERLDQATRTRASGTFQLLVDRVIECQKTGLFGAGDATTQAAFAWSALHGLASLHLTGNLTDTMRNTLVNVQLAGIEAALRGGDCWPAIADIPRPSTP